MYRKNNNALKKQRERKKGRREGGREGGRKEGKRKEKLVIKSKERKKRKWKSVEYLFTGDQTIYQRINYKAKDKTVNLKCDAETSLPIGICPS